MTLPLHLCIYFLQISAFILEWLQYKIVANSMSIELSLKEIKTLISYGQVTAYAAGCTLVYGFQTLEDNNNEKSFLYIKRKNTDIRFSTIKKIFILKDFFVKTIL